MVSRRAAGEDIEGVFIIAEVVLGLDAEVDALLAKIEVHRLDALDPSHQEVGGPAAKVDGPAGAQGIDVEAPQTILQGRLEATEVDIATAC